nr:radial spoke head protein 3 homolog B-like isoform X2 [Lepeophtheirus salmonis]
MVNGTLIEEGGVFLDLNRFKAKGLKINSEASYSFKSKVALPALRAHESSHKFVRKCSIPISERKSSLPPLISSRSGKSPSNSSRSLSKVQNNKDLKSSEKMASVLTLPSHMSGFLHQLGSGQTGVFSYVSYPAAILPNHRHRYKPPPFHHHHRRSPPVSLSSTMNLSRDRRQFKGIPPQSLKANVSPTEEALFRQREVEKRSYLRKKILPDIKGRVSSLNSSGSSSQRSSPPSLINSNDVRSTLNRSRTRKRITRDRPPMGRKHCDIQTDAWLEEINDKPPEFEIGIQTSIDDVSRPPTPKLAFQPSGIDKSTQILPDDPELFIFDEEVTIVLEDLVGKTLEQSLIEVVEEEELAAITQQKLHFQTKKVIALSSS